MGRVVRGMRDILPTTQRTFQRIKEVAASNAKRYRFQEISTPILEHTELFTGAIGTETDVVSKEMFSFEDGSKGKSVTLRPEGTAGVVMAAIRGNLLHELPQRLFYSGPMFRRERPQKGRYRQFDQFGVEQIGVSHPHCDAEVISLGYDILRDLGVDHAVELRINTLCDEATRGAHHEAMASFLHDCRGDLSADSRRRLEAGNLLRILDSKAKEDQECLQAAPTLLDVASEESKRTFGQVLKGLDALAIPFTIDHRLVRGLDYYTSTVWEFVTDRLGAQAAVLAGGRYDNLVKVLDGKRAVPAVGWAAGVDRLALLMYECDGDVAEPPPTVWVVQVRKRANDSAADKEVRIECLRLVQKLRRLGFVTEYNHTGNVSAQMRAAQKADTSWVLLMGEDEVTSGTVAVKNMTTGAQESISLEHQDWKTIFA
eukprot:m.31496 g.31496  ORF g.31496 m.31496 type:complete len:428 (+) comp16469_c0_seq1:103-1386(+)